MQENEMIKDRSLIYMVIGLGIVILIMGYLTLYVDDAGSLFSIKETKAVQNVVEDNNNDALLKNSNMSDEEIKLSLIKFIEAFYTDQRRGYFDPPSYFSSIINTYYNYHNLTYQRLKEIHMRRSSDMKNYNLRWIVSTLDYKRNNHELLTTYWAKVNYLQPSRKVEVSADIKYELAINEDGKITSLREIEIKNLIELVYQKPIDSGIIVIAEQSQTLVPPEKAPEPISLAAENINTEALYEGKLHDLGSVDIAPEYPGGQLALGKFLGSKLRYPARARENKVQGKVYIGFVVGKNGDLGDFKVIRGIGAGCDEEAIRVLRSSPSWKAGIAKGKAVRTAYVLPITFQLFN